MSKKVISPGNVPQPVGQYSNGIAAGNLVFVSGQLPIDAATGEMEMTDIKKATKHSLDNVKTILEAAGASMENVVKTTVFLSDIKDLADVNEVYATYFASEPPARSSFAVGCLPRGGILEIEAIAYRE